MEKLTDKPHTLYITHGGKSTIRGLTRKLYPDDYHWVVFYNTKTYRYQIDDLTTVPLQDEQGNKLTASSQFPSFASYHELMKFIGRYAEKIRTVALDANLSDVGGENFSEVAHGITYQAQCEEAFFFTDTPACIEDTHRYLDYQHALKPSRYLKHARVACRGELALLNIPFKEINHSLATMARSPKLESEDVNLSDSEGVVQKNQQMISDEPNSTHTQSYSYHQVISEHPTDRNLFEVERVENEETYRPRFESPVDEPQDKKPMDSLKVSIKVKVKKDSSEQSSCCPSLSFLSCSLFSRFSKKRSRVAVENYNITEHRFDVK